MNKELRKKIMGKPQRRAAVLEREAVDIEARTVELAFSSQLPYERYWGIEILDHSEGAMQMDRIQDRAAVLLDHDLDQLIGVVESAWVDSDGVGRAKVRFGRGALASEIFDDIVDEIRGQVSVGYMVDDMVLTKSGDDGPDEYLVKKWTPYEISIVSVAADPSVGVGRSIEETPPAIEPEKKEDTTMSETIQTPVVDVKAERGSATKAETDRVSDIIAVGRKFDKMDEALKAIHDSTPVAEFQRAVFDSLEAPKGATHPGDVDLSEKDRKAYSISRAIEAKLDNDWSKAGLEKEISDTLAKQLGRRPQGFFVPPSATSRVMVSGTATGMIGSDHRAADFIDLLYNASFLGKVNATVLRDLTADLDIPKLTAGASFTWINNETTDGSLTTPTTASVAMSPNTITGAVGASRKMLLQSNPGIDMMIENDLVAGLSQALDIAAINGAGTAAPLGILNQTGLEYSAGGTNGAAPDWANVVGVETIVAENNAMGSSMAYVTTPGMKGYFKTTEKTSGNGQYIWGEGETLNGYNAITTQSMPSNLAKGTHTATDLHSMIFGDFSQLLVAFWGGLDIKPDEITAINRGQVNIHAFLDADIAVRRIQAFAAMVDAII